MSVLKKIARTTYIVEEALNRIYRSKLLRIQIQLSQLLLRTYRYCRWQFGVRSYSALRSIRSYLLYTFLAHQTSTKTLCLSRLLLFLKCPFSDPIHLQWLRRQCRNYGVVLKSIIYIAQAWHKLFKLLKR